MSAFLARRALALPLILLGVSAVTFVLMHLIPGDPVRIFLGSEGAVPPEAIERLRAQWGLDKPLYIQYFYYIANLLRGDLGYAIHTAQPVSQDLLRRLPATLELSMAGFTIALLISIPLGIISAVKKDTWIDHLSRVTSLFFLSMPNFWIGLMLIYLLYFTFKVVPAPMGRLGLTDTPPPFITGLYTIDSLLAGDLSTFVKSLKQLILPALVLSFTSIGLIVRMLRSSMLEILQMDYIRTAEAKGLSYFVINCKHALRNALIPTITILAIQLGSLMGGNVVVETVFNWPGIGLYFVTAIQWLDYAPVIGIAVMIATIFVIFNFIADVVYALIDPRIKYG
ncbi:MAG: Dipeptide transport system permease protein dppB [Acetothermia bacterium 64_32]|nr:MAG: Dipeptide transport system permease protein dppB [Acetothermia bacterium 64_32]MBC7098839.1 ABC transporter permease [Candidatus Bipolaricaulota bacterium]HAF69818.1 peptide ABC transporter permease [Candidatus Acetothermia bacterium]